MLCRCTLAGSGVEGEDVYAKLSNIEPKRPRDFPKHPLWNRVEKVTTKEVARHKVWEPVLIKIR